MLLFLLACTQTSKVEFPDSAGMGDSAGVDSGDSAPTDSVPVDTAPDHTGETADTAPGETGDTGPRETGETGGDTATTPLCFSDIASPVDYTTSGVVLNSTCTGTNHQDITGVQRVVFVGDSVTAGAPIPTDWSSWDLTPAEDWYRNRLAADFVDRWGLEAPDWFWQNVDLTSGESWTKESGDFANCAKWGARTDDLHSDNTQLDDCLAEDKRDVHNLVIMTIGGNDLYNLLDHLKNGDADEATIRAEWQAGIDDLAAAIHWLRDDPSMFPGGLDVIVANIFDVTDATSALDIADCEGAQLIGLSEPLVDPLTAELALQWEEALLQLAAETDIDVAFMGETFCGHGYNWDDTTGRCYRGGDPTVYFDASCEHPSSDGHAAIERMMLGVVEE